MKNRLATRTLITALLLLQLVAPLVHAHLGFDNSPPGVHVPGLEFVTHRVEDNVFKSATSKLTPDGIVVAIVTGAGHHYCLVVERGNAVFVPAPGNLQFRDCLCQGLARSPPFPAPLPQPHYSPASPRAPPYSPSSMT